MSVTIIIFSFVREQNGKFLTRTNYYLERTDKKILENT